MLSFIRKRFPSKDRSGEHLRNVKSNCVEHKYKIDDGLKKSHSTNDINLNNNESKKNKKKAKKEKSRCSSTLDGLIVSSNTSPVDNQINKSYSDVDYFPMMSGALSQPINDNKKLTNLDSLSDCYLNPLETIKTTNDISNTEASQIKTKALKIPVIDCRQNPELSNYKDIDHKRTKVLRMATEEFVQKR